MVPGPARAPHPLQVLRRPHHRVMRNGVSPWTMHEMSPLIDILRPRLDGLFPAAIHPGIGNAAGSQYTQNLIHAHTSQVFDDNKIDEVLDIGKPLAGQPVDRYAAVDPQRMDMLPGSLDLLSVGVETVHLVGRGPAQRSGKPSIAAAQMNNESAVNTRRVEDGASLP